MKIHRSWIRLFFVLTLPALSPVAFLTPAQAATCFYGPSHYYDGYQESAAAHSAGYVYEGVSLLITARAGAFCSAPTGTPNAAASWGSLASADGNSWAQAGNQHKPGENIYEYGEITEPGHYQIAFGPSLSPGTRIGYRSLYSSACGCMQTRADGVIMNSSFTNPYSAWAWPFDVQFFSETWYKDDNIPGTATGHAIFSGLGVQQISNDNLMVIPCNFLTGRNDNVVPPTGELAWHLQYDACDQFETYAQ